MGRTQLIVSGIVFFAQFLSGISKLAAKPVKVELLPQESSVSFEGSTAMNAVHFDGKGIGLSGNFKITAPKAIEGEATFPLDNLQLDMDKRAKHMKEDLEVTKYPIAKFTPTVLPWEDPSQVLTQPTSDRPFEGKMLLHGVEKPVSGTVSTSKNGDKVLFTFKFKVLLQDFDITRRKYMGLQVGNEFKVEVSTLAKVATL